MWNSCFLNTYSLALLTEGYGFRSDNIIRFVDKLEGYKVGWALGSMLYEVVYYYYIVYYYSPYNHAVFFTLFLCSVSRLMPCHGVIQANVLLQMHMIMR